MPEDLLGQAAQLRASSCELRKANKRLLDHFDRLLDNARFAILDVERATEIPDNSVAADTATQAQDNLIDVGAES